MNRVCIFINRVCIFIKNSISYSKFCSTRRLILSKLHPFLGASLDSVVTNVGNLETWGKEIKCPVSELDQSINALKNKKFYLANGKIQLKRSHEYFYQIQGQMFCAQLERVDFVVYLRKNLPLSVEIVTFDKNFGKKFYHELSFSSEGLLSLNCSPAEFKEVKNYINMVAGRLIKKRKKTAIFNSHTS